MGFYELLINSQCISYSGWRSARPQFGEAAAVLPVQEANSVLLWTSLSPHQPNSIGEISHFTSQNMRAADLLLS